MKLKVKFNTIIACLFVLTYIAKSYTDAVFVSKEIESNWTYVKFLLIMLVFAAGLAYMTLVGKRWKNLHILVYVGIAALAIFAISAVKMMVVGHFSLAVVNYCFRLILSACIAVIITNTLDSTTIRHCFVVMLLSSIAIYLVFEVGISYIKWQYIKMISFDTSYSPFESHYSAAMAMAMCLYFSYHRENKKLSLIALVFTLLVFKRLFVVFGLIFFFLPLFIEKNTYVGRKTHMLFAIGFTAATILYYWYLIPENQDRLCEILHVDSLVSLTSGRNIFFSQVYHGDVIDFGYGSCEAYLGRSIEMELIQLLMEVSVFGVAILCISYWSVAGCSIYGIVHMTFQFLNLLTSHSLYDGFSWGLFFIIILSMDKPINKGMGNKGITA